MRGSALSAHREKGVRYYDGGATHSTRSAAGLYLPHPFAVCVHICLCSTAERCRRVTQWRVTLIFSDKLD